MQRHDFLMAPSREDARTERRRSWYGDRYCGTGGHPLAPSAWVFTNSAEYDNLLTTERQEPPPGRAAHRPIVRETAVHRGQAVLLRDRLQETWGASSRKARWNTSQSWHW